MTKPTRPPKDDLVRAVFPGVELRAVSEDEPADDGRLGTLTGHFAVFNSWTEIDSIWEGRFLERIAPGAFRKTFRENRDGMRVLFQHGGDPQVGDKPLGPIDELEEDESGARYEVPLLDTSYNRDILPGLQAGLYGASFRFRVVKEEVNQKPTISDYNPSGIPERTIKEAQVFEFGPVTFPAYANATAGVRSLTDVYIFDRFTRDPERLREVVESLRDGAPALPDRGAEDVPHSDAGSRDKPPAPPVEPPVVEASKTTDPAPKAGSLSVRETPIVNTIEEVRARLDEIKTRFAELDKEIGISRKSDEQAVEWDALVDERSDLQARVTDYEQRQAIVAEATKEERKVERPVTRTSVTASKVPSNLWDLPEYRNTTRTQAEYKQALRDGAMRAVEIASFPHPEAERSKVQEHIANLLDNKDDEQGTIAQRLLATGSPAYQRAFGKTLAGIEMSHEERTALSLGSNGGVAVPFILDPTIIPTSNGTVNPLRQIARVETVTQNTWKGVSSAGITASYDGEAVEVGDDGSTLSQPEASAIKAQAFVPYSIEVGQDWNSLQSEMAALLQDSKDELEGTKFVLGTGTVEPEGIIAGVGTANTTDTAGTAAFAVADLYSLEEAVPPRFRPLASILGNRAIFNKVRQFDTSGGAALWVRLGQGLAPELIGYPAYEASAMDSVLTAGSEILVMGDFRHFLIVDRIGLNVEVVPHLFATGANRPNGQRGLYAYWRNTSKVLVPSALQILRTLS